jgi:radical SAM superfamily enzyme YgiQ (UPF0313 family)
VWHNAIVRVVLISTYELGRQPFGLASPAAWLRRAGAEVTALDLSRQRLDEEAVRAAAVAAFFLPMHTATRLALPVIDRVRALNPRARLCAFGLYAPPNRPLLREHGVATTFGAEFEADLVAFVEGAISEPLHSQEVGTGLRRGAGQPVQIARLDFITPDRSGLPPLDRYATLQEHNGRRVVGYTESSRGCRHLCRHCPVVPIYDGQFRIVPVDVVLADVRNQAAAGATHITFGDPDFFNGPSHGLKVASALHAEFPDLTYDVTIKVEHLLRHPDALPRLRETGCLFVTTAVESVDDAVLAKLDKGHTAEDFGRVVALCRQADLALAPTFVPFTPWTTLEAYVTLLETVADLDLVECVAPVQYGLRLLIPEGSRLLDLPEIRAMVGDFTRAALAHPWTHRDLRVDALQREVVTIAGRGVTADRQAAFGRVWQRAHEYLGRVDPPSAVPSRPSASRRPPVPYLNEPWYC